MIGYIASGCTDPPSLRAFFSGLLHPDLSKGFHEKHCVMWGVDLEFTTSNYGLTTTPRNEYEISLGKRPGPEKDMQDKKGKTVRRIRQIEKLIQDDLSRKAGLTHDEILTVVCAKYAPIFSCMSW